MKTGGAPFLEARYRRYAIQVNEHRAVPRFTDGLKQAQRIALWVMKNEGIGKIKTAAMAGRMIASSLYNHGDAPAQETLGHMAGPFLNNLPLLLGEGNFGTKIDPQGMAAGRYTDVERQPFLDDLVYHDLPILEMENNYDGSAQMPSTFYPVLPLVLINGSVGVGVGYSTSIFPRDPEAVATAVQQLLANPKAKLKNLEPFYTTLTKDRAIFEKYTDDGKAVWILSGSATIVDTSTVIVTNLPPVAKLDLTSFREFLIDLEEKGQIKSWIDNSSKDFSITVKFNRGSISGWSEDDALTFLKLKRRATETIVMVAPTNNAIVSYTYDENNETPDPVHRYLKDWVEWRFSKYKQRFEYLLMMAERDLMYQTVLKHCFEQNLPKQILSMANRGEVTTAIEQIAVAAGYTFEQLAEYPEMVGKIADRASYRWTTDAHAEVQSEIDRLIALVADHKAHVASPDLQRAVFVSDVSQAGSKIKRGMKALSA